MKDLRNEEDSKKKKHMLEKITYNWFTGEWDVKDLTEEKDERWRLIGRMKDLLKAGPFSLRHWSLSWTFSRRVSNNWCTWELAAESRKIRNSLFTSFQNPNTFDRHFDQKNNSPPQVYPLGDFLKKNVYPLWNQDTKLHRYSGDYAWSDKWWTFHCCLQQYQPNPLWFSSTSNLVI